MNSSHLSTVWGTNWPILTKKAINWHEKLIDSLFTTQEKRRILLQREELRYCKVFPLISLGFLKAHKNYHSLILLSINLCFALLQLLMMLTLSCHLVVFSDWRGQPGSNIVLRCLTPIITSTHMGYFFSAASSSIHELSSRDAKPSCQASCSGYTPNSL